MTNKPLTAEQLEALERFQEWEQRRREEAAAARRVAEMRQDLAPRVAITNVQDGEGMLRCFNEDCADAYKPAGAIKMRSETSSSYFKDPQGNVTNRVENEWTHHHILEPDLLPCPTCGETRQALPPDATDAWDGQKRRLKTNWGSQNIPAGREAQAWNEHLRQEVDRANLEVQKAVKE